VYEPLVLAAAIVLGMTLLRLLRRPNGTPLIFAVLIAGELGMAIAGLGATTRPWGIAAICLCVLTVIVPWFLEGAAKRLFGRGQMTMAVRLTGLRAMLMPGSGLARQQEILCGVSILHREGVDPALRHFRKLLQATEDPQEETLLHEQIVSVLFFAQRWSEASDYFEGHFRLGFALMRPALVLGLLRAYGEAGRIESAAELLYMLEGAVMSDSSRADLLGQARLTFLAYAGEPDYVGLAAGHEELLGMSAPSCALFHGIAFERAGKVKRAVYEFDRVEELAGAKDSRMREASKNAITRVLHWPKSAPEIDHEMGRYVVAVGERLESFLCHSDRAPPRRGSMLVTYSLVGLMIVGYGATLVLDHGGLGLIALGGFTRELLEAGSWGRLFTAPYVHGDLISLVLDLYSIWLAGHIIERLQGSSRMLAITLGGAAAGLWAGSIAEPLSMTMIAGGPVMAVAAVVGALWTLVPARRWTVSARARRSLMLTLLLLLGAQMLACLPSMVGLAVTPISLGAAALVATILATTFLGPKFPYSRWLSRVFTALMLALLGFGLIGAYHVLGEDAEAYLVAHRGPDVTIDGVRLALPHGFRRRAERDEGPAGLPLPFYAGLTDETALQGGALVQVAVSPVKDDDVAILALDPGLGREVTIVFEGPVPAPISEALDAAPGAWRSYQISRNGEAVAQVIERRIPNSERALMLIVSPPEAIAHSVDLYAALLAEASSADSE